jgi:DNA-binding MarR family transcriptional regulator
MRMSDFDLTEFLPYQLAAAAARVSRAFAERYRDDFGITIPEWRVLVHLAHSGSVSVREILARVEMDKSKVSRAAQRLTDAGHVEKRPHPEDGRLIDLRLTPAGQALVARLLPIAAEFQAELIASLGTDHAALRRALNRIMEAK